MGYRPRTPVDPSVPMELRIASLERTVDRLVHQNMKMYAQLYAVQVRRKKLLDRADAARMAAAERMVKLMRRMDKVKISRICNSLECGKILLTLHRDQYCRLMQWLRYNQVKKVPRFVVAEARRMEALRRPGRRPRAEPPSPRSASAAAPS